MKLYVNNGLVAPRGGPRECIEVAVGMTVRLHVEGAGPVQGVVNRVFKSGLRIAGKTYLKSNTALYGWQILAEESGLPVYDSFTEERMK